LVSSSFAQGTKREPFPLVNYAGNTCPEIISTHIFDGSCCSLADTDTGGCGGLSVINGRCKLRRLEWIVVVEMQWCVRAIDTQKYVLAIFCRFEEIFGIWTSLCST
jgi:hypothetical protein